MKLNNRFIFGILSLLLAAVIAFVALPTIARQTNGKEEIVRIARKIDTFETSILPYEDCCTVFTPKHPKTKPSLGPVEAEEAKLDVEGLIARAIENTEKIQVRWYEN